MSLLIYVYILIDVFFSVLSKLEEELRQIEEQKAAWEASILGTSHSRADVHLEEAQVIL